MHVYPNFEWPSVDFPVVFTDMASGMTEEQAVYWWRAQAIGYLMRFNNHTLKKIDLMRSGCNFSLSGAISVNIRGGDKWTEGHLISPERMVDKASDLISQMPLSYSRVLFITSDDLDAILRARQHAEKRHHLKVLYCHDVPRMPHGNQEALVPSFWSVNVTISVFMQLLMISECDAWIGSRSSNWNRIMDIFRCARGKCRQPFIEADDAMLGRFDVQQHGFIL